MAPSNLVPVRFLTGCSPFNAGEVAGFTADIAAQLIERGAAQALNFSHHHTGDPFSPAPEPEPAPRPQKRPGASTKPKKSA